MSTRPAKIHSEIYLIKKKKKESGSVSAHLIPVLGSQSNPTVSKNQGGKKGRKEKKKENK